MADVPRITVEELRRRMQAGEAITLIDTRNPQAWAESEVMAPGALRVPVDELEKKLPHIPHSTPIVTYCT